MHATSLALRCAEETAQVQIGQITHLPTPSSTTSFPASYFDLCKEIVDVGSTIRWCQERKLLAACPACSRDMNLVSRNTSPEKRCWRCPRKACRKEVSLRAGTLFSQSHLSIEKILRILYLWSTKTPLGRMMKEVQVTSKFSIVIVTSRIDFFC